MKRDQILEVAFREFTRYGIKKVSIDEIAQKLKISKKTIYEYFSSKEELAVESFKFKHEQLESNVCEIVNATKSPVEAIIRLGMNNFKFFYPISEFYIEELKSMPVLDKVCFEGFNKIKAIVTDLIKEGIENGELYKDENYELLGPLMKSQITNNLNVEELTSRYRPDEICKFTLITLFKGVATPKGRDMLVKLEKEKNI